jgi:4'-phosphopantetheinyl transferase
MENFACELAEGGQVDVWIAQLDAPGERLPDLLNLLSEDERARAKRFHFDRDFRRFVAARAQLRGLIGRYLDRAPETIEFEYGPYGKPALAPGMASTPLYFNLAHSEDMAVFAVSRTHEVGIDIERINAEFPVDEVAARCCCDRENQILRQLTPPTHNEQFFVFWARKEAYCKVYGRGLSLNPERIDTSNGGQIAVYPFSACVDGVLDPTVALYDLSLFSMAPGYAAALAVRGTGADITVQPLPPL